MVVFYYRTQVVAAAVVGQGFFIVVPSSSQYYYHYNYRYPYRTHCPFVFKIEVLVGEVHFGVVNAVAGKALIFIFFV